ncbi:MAG TPA: flagellar basal-body MS-ring/collar protein FliF [Bryobacteraceae bacterium]|nr:flagellar basal-body MS-ring/collar protein FliF [Bryobacteraceae bacterium]
MDQLKQFIAGLTVKQRISYVLVTAAVIAALVGLTRWNRERDFKPIYTGLSSEDAGAVLAKIRESGTDYRLTEGGSSVLVPANRVAELRLQLAAAGVPKSGRIGYELFDKTNFGVSDFAEQINYHRALEGELERSVMALAEVEQARVHITFPKDSIYTESRQPAKASVLVKLRPGSLLSAQNVNAICQLTASAVEGLLPDAVSVVDMRGNLLNRPHKPLSPDDPQPSDAALDYRQQIERDLLTKINTTLEPLLGADKFRAGVSVECDFSSSEQSEETFDPNKSVMTTSQRTEDISTGNQTAGVPGTASNLPHPPARPGAGSGGVTRRTENIAYQASRMVRRVKLPQGNVKKMSVSVLLDHAVRWEGSGPKAKRIVEPPSPERIKAIHDLVAGIVGFSTDRGDQLVVEALPFESTVSPEQLPATPAPPKRDAIGELLANRMVLTVGGGVVAAIILGLVLLVIMRGKKNPRTEIQGQIEAGKPQPAVDSSETIRQQMEAQIAEQAALKKQQETEALHALKMPHVSTKKAEVLTKHIAEEAKKDATTMVQVLRNWINETDR